MAHIPDHNSPGIKESEIKVFEQSYYVVDDEEDMGRRPDYELRKERIEILADTNGVFIESKDNGCGEVLSIATPEMAVRVANYILEVYGKSSPLMDSGESDAYCSPIKFLDPAVQNCVSHELWRLSNHITSPHGPVDAQGSHELYGHLKYLANLLDLEMKPHPKYSTGYKPNYTDKV